MCFPNSLFLQLIFSLDLLRHLRKICAAMFSIYFSLVFSFYIVVFHFHNALYIFISILAKKSTSYLRMLTKLPKMKKIALLLFLWLPSLLSCCGDIEANPDTCLWFFFHWNLSGLTTLDSIRIVLLQACKLQHIYDFYACQKQFWILLFKVMMIGSQHSSGIKEVEFVFIMKNIFL